MRPLVVGALMQDKSSGLTAKQEKFAQVYVETSNASEAYRQSYNVKPDTKPESVWQAASTILADIKVSSRVLELQEEHRKRHNVTVDTLTAELDEDRKLARKVEQPSAAISAVMGKAKLHGLITDKRDHISSDGSMTPRETTPKDIAKAVAFILAKGSKK